MAAIVLLIVTPLDKTSSMMTTFLPPPTWPYLLDSAPAPGSPSTLRWMATSTSSDCATSCANAIPLIEMPTTVSTVSTSSMTTSAMISPMAVMRAGRTPMVLHPTRTSVGRSEVESVRSHWMVSWESDNSSAICCELSPSFRRFLTMVFNSSILSVMLSC